MAKDDPAPQNVDKMWRYAAKFAEKSGTHLHPDRNITEGVVLGLAHNIEAVGRPVCPCNFYPPKELVRNDADDLYLPLVDEAKRRNWICACDEMQKFKYCHCLLFVTKDGLPITEYLPEGHEGREVYGLIEDPTPGQGRALGKIEEKRAAEGNAQA
jgi:ferredoxin-thioredoxin reductase catalytic chain